MLFAMLKGILQRLDALCIPYVRFTTRLKADGYQMDAWRNNQLLRFNEKWATEPTDEEAGDVHPAVLSVIRAADRARPSKAKRR